MKASTQDWKAHRKRTLIHLAIWAVAYLFTMALAAFGPQLLWESNAAFTGIAILLTLGTGIGMIVTNIHQLKSLDEMMQKIQLEAMAISLGVGVIGGLSYSLMDTENLIPFDAEIGHMVILICVTYLISILMGYRRYG